ncbi:HGGxSTG domain-containing protein [Brevibacillus parabrevis]|uniref:HGGxSTG domain-containing protein n=1 Tax=Brevibacillus parabrevis TaxID=54914 RepID=UPI00285369F8|nr:HGGxSTG domain-containing protein [Brevibacillus parabrevis]MDR4997405.1 HGGxSTG domain-containing protein [Brevibacillus parabrevis]
MEKKLCGANTRTGGLCKKAALANGRCRLHGGKSTGPKDPSKLKGNKNALKHGLYETIWEDTLTDEERELLAHVSTDPKAQVESELKLSEIRILRMMRRIKQEEQKKKPNSALIRAIEEGITRIGMNKVSLVRESSRLLEVQGKKSDGSLDQLVEILAQARKEHIRS